MKESTENKRQIVVLNQERLQYSSQKFGEQV